MGTSYYLEYEDRKDIYYIGKSSKGWYFSLNVIPEKVNSFDDWVVLFNKYRIFDEYKQEISVEEMVQIISKRSGYSRSQKDSHPDIKSGIAEEVKFGDNFYLRYVVGKICLSHGDGPWSLVHNLY